MSEMKKQDNNAAESETRREFLRSSVRYVALATLLAGSGRLIFRGGGKCEREIPCSGCSLFTGCELPQADLARQSGSPLTRGAEGRG